MPIYYYRCQSCNHKFEQWFLTFTASESFEKATQCPQCGQEADRDFNGEVPAYPLAFYGKPDGYHKPAPSKRNSYNKNE